MIPFVRPTVAVEEYRNRDGSVIPYGSRWADQDGDGPDDTYSVTRHPERFAPFVVAAGALAEHLATAYDVVRHETADGIDLRPADPLAAALSFRFSSDPWVQVLAGATTELVNECSCDHCDCDVLGLIEDLEESVAAVVDGRLREWLNEGARHHPNHLFLAYELSTDEGGSSGSSAVDSPTERDALRARFAHVPDRWSAWTPRR